MRPGSPLRLQPLAPLETAPAKPGDVIPVRALPAVLRDSGAARLASHSQPVDQGPAFRLARKGLPHGRSRQSSEGPQRSIHVSSTPDRRKNSAAAMVNPHIRARAPTTTVTYDDRTLGPFPASPPVSVRYRQGRDRPCAGLRWPRTVNRGRRTPCDAEQALADPSLRCCCWTRHSRPSLRSETSTLRTLARGCQAAARLLRSATALRVTAAADRAGSPCGPAGRLALVQQEHGRHAGTGMAPPDCRHGRRRRSAQPSSTRSALLA